MQFTVEEENLICMYHKSDRRRTAANIRAALPDMGEDMAALARQTADKLDAMHDADFEARQFHFTDEESKHSKAPGAGAVCLCVRRFAYYSNFKAPLTGICSSEIAMSL